MNNKLRNALRKEPILMFTEPIGRIISSQTKLSLEIKTRIIGKIISLMIDWIKFEAAIAIIKPIEIPIILYSLTNFLNPFKTAMIHYVNFIVYKNIFY